MGIVFFGRKFSNLIKVALKYNFDLPLRTAPVLVEMDITNKCNLKCVMCPNRKVKKQKGLMSLELFKDVVEQTRERALEYSIGVCGEPLLHPDLIKMIKYIKDRDCSVTLNTNLNHQQDSLNEDLIRQKVDRLMVTMCGVNKATYESICINGDFDCVINNLKAIKSYKRQLKRNKPVVVANFIEMKLNAGQRDSVKKSLGEYVDHCNIPMMHDWGGDQEIRDLKLAGAKKKNNTKCSSPWTTATVLYDGKISPCCQDYEGKIVFGDSGNMKLSDIWNSSFAEHFRKHYAEGIPCRDCGSPASQFSMKNIFFTVKTTI